MAKLDVTREDITAIGMVNMAFDKAIFPMVEGTEVTNLATSRARLIGLRSKLDKYLAELNEETMAAMEKKAAAKDKPKDPIKKAK